ncbi:MAG: carboxypeptidase regulatory-like domain-containing protein [Thermodesulfobacteriota bacterium]
MNQAQRRSMSLLKLFFVMLLCVSPFKAQAADSLCAEVKLEIKQELSLERQAFDAHMRINNGLTNISLDQVGIVVNFTDEDGNPVIASFDPNADPNTTRFFIRVDSMDNIADIDGTGVVAPSTSADIHWLIIPAQGAAQGLPQGKLYYVGATLTYRINGEENVTTVTPDYIYVKPLPDLALDYFMPEEVYGDDAFTGAIEPPVPYSLGLRVKNIGLGIARNVKIESAQPKITENTQGLLIGFVIEAAESNGVIASNTLLASLGDIAPETAGTARWVMTSSLSGRFVDFSASVAHADELGGDLTSLIQTENLKTHFMIRDVLLDLPGRDAIRDFLARDGAALKLFESSGVDTAVTDFSSSSSLTPAGSSGTETYFSLSTTETSGLGYVRLADPHAGARVLKSVVRSDGKIIKPENAWLSKSRKAVASEGWNYFVHLFDAGATNAYTLTFDDPLNLPQAPVLEFIPDRSGAEGQQLGFLIQASDPNGTIPALSAEALPVGADLTDNGDGTAAFLWTPAGGQAGSYTITFKASDGTLTAVRRATLTIFNPEDSDGDGMADSWELAHFGTLDRDGSGDFDGDGISDLDEFLNGTDPGRSDHAPSVPVILAPALDAGVDTRSPVLQVENSTDADGDTLTYEFEVFTDDSLTEKVASQTGVVQGTDATGWTLPMELDDNTAYTFRVRARDAVSASLWAYGRFFVNTENDPPTAPRPDTPADGRNVDSVTPMLRALAGIDPDDDPVTHTVEIYTDVAMTELLIEGPGWVTDSGRTVAFQVADPQLIDQTTYYWRVIARDSLGAETEGQPASFSVNLANHAPGLPAILAPAEGLEITGTTVNLEVTNAEDMDGDVLTYTFEIDTSAAFDSPAKQVSAPVPAGDAETAWQVSGLSDNTVYFWRVRADDGIAQGPWAAAECFVNTGNDEPAAPVVKNPGHHAWTTTLRPTLSAAPAGDADRDGLTYEFELYRNAALTELAAAGGGPSSDWTLPLDLTPNTRYFWRVQVTDQHGLAGDWSETADLFVQEESTPEVLAIGVSTSSGRTLAGVPVYAFTQAGAYTGLVRTTDPAGRAAFDPAAFNEGSHTFRIDYLGRQFWSDPVSLPGATALDVVIPTETVSLDVTTAAGPSPDTRVYVFGPGNAYLSVNGITDGAGRVVFELPAGGTYDFRADLMGSQYWSGASQVTAGGANTFDVTAGGGEFTVSVGEDGATPLPGLRVYLFHQNGAYLNRNAITDAQGQARFDVSAGTYRVRADYLGYQFWSDYTEVTADRAATLPIPHQDVAVTVSASYQGGAEPLAGVPVYLFTREMAYQNRSAVTNGSGQVVFHLPAGAYKVRADYRSGQFLSEEFNQTDAAVVVPMAEARVRVGWNTAFLPDVPVYVFTAGGAYLSLNSVSGGDGTVLFRLPAGGQYKFRADYQTGQFWSNETVLPADQISPVDISTGGGSFTFTALRDAGESIEGINCYVFSEAGAYFGVYGPTGAEGAVSFDLADGIYNIRADYLGYQFWSYQHEMPGPLSGQLVIPHEPVTVSVGGRFDGEVTPLADTPVYLFTAAGAYQNRMLTTDAQGQVVFDLPDREYKVRADYLSGQFWSTAFNQQDMAVAIPMADAEITVTYGGAPLAGVPVYAYTAAHAYLNRHQTTGTDGRAVFRLPASGTYEFRADYQASQYWSGETSLPADQVSPVAISTGGGPFIFTVRKSENEPLAGVACYVFNEAGTYLNLNNVTSSEGQATFELANGNYKFRVDYLGYQYWSTVSQVPAVSTSTLTIPHADVTVGVGSLYQGVSEPLAGVPVYLFTAAGSYQNLIQTTDAVGQVLFRLPPGEYKARADYRSRQFWSTVFNQADADVEIPMADARITVLSAGAPVANAPVYAYTAGRGYLNLTQTTDAAGQVLFRLPAGSAYDFRADYQGSQYWADDAALTADLVNPVTISAGGGVFELTVRKDLDLPLPGVRCYVFSQAGAYLGLSGTADAQGRVLFNLADGSYRFRVDYLGYQFWTGIHTVPASLADDFLIPHQEVTVTVESLYQNPAPLGGVKVYLFTQSGAYQNQNQTTGADGRVTFSLPEKAYKVRADYLGYQFWSAAPFTWTDPLVTIDHGLARVHTHRAGVDQPGARVYLYTGAGAYMNQYKDTGTTGLAEFLLPNQPYKFRADQGVDSVYSNTITVTPGVETVVEVDLD